MIDKSRIAIVSTVINFDLYNKSVEYFPDRVKRYVIDGRNGMHGIHSLLYVFKKLPLEGIDWLIMADEDIIFYDSNIIFEIIEQMNDKSFTVCGIRDGGEILHRNYNPFLINMFFSILKTSDIKSIFNRKDILANQFIIKNEFSDDLKELKFNYDKLSLYEPYYCFYLWLRRNNKKILFLDSKMENDQISNSVFFNDKKILTHTWYARSYGLNKKHTNRINNYFNNLKPSLNKSVEYEIYKDFYFATKQTIKKYLKKIKIKLGTSALWEKMLQ